VNPFQSFVLLVEHILHRPSQSPERHDPMALTWTRPATPQLPGDERVGLTTATCGPFRATVYALEPIEDRFFYDIDFATSSASAPYVRKDSGDSKITGVLDTPARAQRAAALRLQAIVSKMTSTLGAVK
jgi:hypothetical protein